MGLHLNCLQYAECAFQYSKGEYTYANNQQDDFKIIAKRGLSFREKTHQGIVPLKFNGTAVPALLNRGQIVQNTDADVFSFRVDGGTGRAKLKIDRTEPNYGSMLDVDAEIKDAAGKSMARSNKTGMRDAEFDLSLPAGSYTLTIKGGAEGTPDSGFTNYSSLGFYAIEGEITGGGTTGMAKGTPDPSDLVHPVLIAGRLYLDIRREAQVGKIALYSARGTRVFTSQGRVPVIDMSGLATGIYVLGVDIGDATVKRNVFKP
jgi:hypothetical protein